MPKTAEYKKLIDEAIEATKGYDEPYRTEAFKVILSKSIEILTPTAERTEKKHKVGRTHKGVSRPSQMVIPIPLDLKEKNGKPSLREFYKQKEPKSAGEALTVFAYYLKEHLKIPRMEAGQVVSCCKEVGRKVPRNIAQMFYDIQHRDGWLNVGEGRKYVEINTAGENLVTHDLPRKEDDS